MKLTDIKTTSIPPVILLDRLLALRLSFFRVMSILFIILAMSDILSLWGRASSATAANRHTPPIYNNKRNPRPHNSKKSEDF